MIQVIHRALDIIEFVARDRDKEFGLGEISEGLGLNKGTCANIMKTLVNRGYLEQSGKKRGYKLGSEAYYLTGNFFLKEALLKVSGEPMKILQGKLNECCILAVLKDDMRYTLHKVSSTQELQVITNNEEKHVYLTATGRMILACMDQPERELFIQKFGLPGDMWEGIGDKNDLDRSLDRIKAEQLAIHYDGAHVVGVGAPVYKNDKIIASLGIYLPEVRFSKSFRKLIYSEISQAASLISEKISTS
jgi:DNA-binding IclR family transcriptional regulator